MPTTLYRPNGESFADSLKKKKWSRTQIKTHTWKFHYVFSLVLRQRQHCNAEYVRLRMGELDKLFSNTVVNGKSVRLSTLVVNYLEDWGFFIRRRFNSDFENAEGLKCHKTEVFVKFTDEALAPGWSVWEPTAETAPAPAKARTIKKNVLTGIYKELENQFPRITIDAAAARAMTEDAYRTRMPLRDKRREITLADGKVGYRIEKNRYVNEAVRSAWHLWIDAVEVGDFRGTQDEEGTGRFFHAITSSPTHLRGTLRIDGLPLKEVDIANCQPLLFCTYLKAHFATNMPPKVQEFITACEKGTFYDTIRTLVLTDKEQANLSKQDFKTRFFARIFYSTEKRDWLWRKKFADEYPEVSKYITAMKVGGYKELPRALSRKESTIMLHGVAAKLLAAGAAFVPLHDAIYATADFLPLAEQLIYEEFALQGVRVTINKPTMQPVAVAPPTTDELIARLETGFAAISHEEVVVELEVIGTPCDTDLWA